MKNWQNVNFIESINFTNEKVTEINKTNRGEYWMKTKTNNEQLYWLADTGRLRNFRNIETLCKLVVKEKRSIMNPETSLGEFNCYNNNKINIKGTIQVDIQSGSSQAKNCTILLVDINTINITRTDVMDKLGIHLSVSPKEVKGEKN